MAADSAGRETPELHALLDVMVRLRSPQGCPWDREQTIASLIPFTIEEAYEVADAAQRGDMAHLKDELGDLLFQVVFFAQMASEAGQFDFNDIAGAIRAKLVRRHPHVFDAEEPQSSSARQLVAWENIKAEERAASNTGVHPPGALDGVPVALPAVLRAYKLSRRAARVGFDFQHASQSADKVAEELAEVRAAVAARPGDEASDAVFEEVGDLLFAVTNLARKLDVDAEAALRAANAKFERRFRGMEDAARARGQRFETLDLSAQEALWQEVKRAE